MAAITYKWEVVHAPVLVNDHTTDWDQANPAIATATDGTILTSWDLPGDVMFRPFNPDGSSGFFSDSGAWSIRTETSINYRYPGIQTGASISPLLNGRSVIAYTDYGSDPGGDIMLTALDLDFFPDIYLDIDKSADDDSDPDVTGLLDGGFVVTWTRDYGGNDHDIDLRFFNKNGSPRAPRDSTNLRTDYSSTNSSVTVLADGWVAIAWEDTPTDGGKTSVAYILYTPDGVQQGSWRTIPSDRQSTEPQIIGLRDGGVAIAYTETNSAGDTDITLRFYDALGWPRGGPIRVNTQTAGDQHQPSLALLSNGALVVGWVSDSSAWQQAFDPATGARLGGNFASATGAVESEIAGLFDFGQLAQLWTSTVPDSPNGDLSVRLGITELTRTTTGTDASEILAGDVLRDTVKGGGGGDFIIGFGGGNTMDGGAGFDSVSWYSESFGVLIDLKDQADNGGAALGDKVYNFEAYYLTGFSDDFTGTNAGAFVYGFGGNDTIETGSGTDFIDGGAGADKIDAGGGFDYVSWNNSSSGLIIDMNDPAKNTGEAKGDIVENAEAFYLSEFNDVFTGQNTGQNIVFGQAGNDKLYGGASSNDWLFGGAGNDTLVGGTLNDLLSGGDGKDTYYFSDYRTNGLDQILDFVSGQDSLTFAGAGLGLAAGANLHAGTSFIASSAPLPKAAGATFLYNTANGFLSFDPDGTGPQDAVALMQLAGHPALTTSDFHIA